MDTKDIDQNKSDKTLKPKKVRRWHEAISVSAPTISLIIAAVSTVIATAAFLSQMIQNQLMRTQIDQQRSQNNTQRQQFTMGRRTELARVVFDAQTHVTLKSDAVRELISLEQRPYGKSLKEEEAMALRWKEASAELNGDQRKKKLAAIAIWKCEQFTESGGGSGTTDRRILDLRNANLAGVDFSNIDLRCVDLSGADLSEANFSDASLSGVLLDGVRLKGATFGSNAIYWTVLNPVDDRETGGAASRIFENNFGEYVAVPCFTPRTYRGSNKAQILTKCAEETPN